MVHYDTALGQPEIPPLAQQQVQHTLYVAGTLQHLQNPPQFSDYMSKELDVSREVADEKGYSIAQGQVALIGVALGDSVSSPEKALIFQSEYPRLMDALTKAGMEDEDTSFIGNAVTHIANNRGNISVILDVVAGIDAYAAHRKGKGADVSLARTTLYAVGFGASAVDKATKSSMASKLRGQQTD